VFTGGNKSQGSSNEGKSSHKRKQITRQLKQRKKCSQEETNHKAAQIRKKLFTGENKSQGSSNKKNCSQEETNHKSAQTNKQKSVHRRKQITRQLKQKELEYCKVAHEDKLSDTIVINTGRRQGCSSSPIILLMAMDDVRE
jgi:hypothetical protein